MAATANDNFRTVLIEDCVLSGLTDKVKYGVVKGGANITAVQFNAVSASASQIVLNIQVSSENVVIDYFASFIRNRGSSNRAVYSIRQHRCITSVSITIIIFSHDGDHQ